MKPGPFTLLSFGALDGAAISALRLLLGSTSSLRTADVLVLGSLIVLHVGQRTRYLTGFVGSAGVGMVTSQTVRHDPHVSRSFVDAAGLGGDAGFAGAAESIL